VSDRLAIPECDRLNLSDAWLRSTAEAIPEGLAAIDPSAPRRIYLDVTCEIFALVSPEDYAWASQWKWGWVWDRTRTKRYARRTPRGAGGKPQTVWLHKEVLKRSGKVQPSELHTIGDHQDGESLNDQRDNLEWATRSMNRRNRKR
jgi:hypothetical protein